MHSKDYNFLLRVAIKAVKCFLLFTFGLGIAFILAIVFGQIQIGNQLLSYWLPYMRSAVVIFLMLVVGIVWESWR